MAGNMIPPMAIRVTGEEPDSAAKITLASRAAMASPPRIPPTRASATATSRRAMLPALMMAPDTTKKGMARKTFLLVKLVIFTMRICSPSMPEWPA